MLVEIERERMEFVMKDEVIHVRHTAEVDKYTSKKTSKTETSFQEKEQSIGFSKIIWKKKQQV